LIDRKRQAEIEAEKQELGIAAEAPKPVREEWQAPEYKDEWRRDEEGYEVRLKPLPYMS